MDVMSMTKLSANLTQLHRPIRLRLDRDDEKLDDVLLVKHVRGQETLCGGIEYCLLCVATQATLPLKEFIALPVELQFVTDQGELRSVCGIVAQASAGQSDGGLATYQLVVRDALALMEQRINMRIFRNANEVEISEALVREWRNVNPILAKTFEIDLSGLTKIYPARELTMQYNESDTAFLRRLWKRQGIASFIRPGACAQRDGSTAPVHTLVLFDDPQALAKNAAGTVRYHRDAATESRDSVFNWCAVRNLKSGSIARQSWDYKQGRMTSLQLPTTARQGQAGDQFAFSLEDHQIEVPHVGDDSTDFHRIGQLRIQRHEYETKCFHGESGVRDFCVGQWFRLDGHSDIDTHPDDERDFVLTELSLVAENNLPKDIDERAQRLFDANGWHQTAHARLEQASEEREVKYTNRFTCVRRGIPIVPAYDPRIDLPRVPLQSAIVVGPQGEEVHCDELGRVKLRFPGTREQDHQSGAGASNTEKDSAWVRVASYWAGDRWGSISLPRVGDEVLVEFLGGDPDKPIVVGRVYSGIAAPPAFSHTNGLPGNRFLAGIKSKEVGGMRHNQLRLDDTPGQISAQLASEHGHSQLNLGYLTHPRRDGTGEARGEGAELRSDQSVVVRAARLMLLTTQAMLGAAGRQLEREPLQALLEGSQALLKELGAFAEQHQAMPLDLGCHQQLTDNLKNAGQAESAASGAAPLIAQYAAGGFVSATPHSSVSYSGRQQNIVAQEHIQAMAGQHVNIQAGKGMSLFAHQGVMKHIARTGKLDIQAQQDSIGIAADRDVKITASQGDIVIAAKTSITFLCGGAYIKIADGKIEHGCAGDFIVKAGMHKWDGPASQTAKLPFFPAAKHTNWLKLDLDGYQGAPMVGVPYTLHFADGQQKEGTLDTNGMAEERNLPDTVTKVIYHNAPSAKDASRPTTGDLMSGLDPLIAKETGHGEPVPRSGGMVMANDETLDALNEVRGEQKPDDVGLGEWIWGALQGDLNAERSTAQIGFDMVVSLIPVVDTICDLRDLCANVREYRKDPSNKITLFFIATTAIGFVPEIGTVAKSALRVVWIYLKPLVKHAGDITNAGKLIAATNRACDAALPKITEYLQHNRVVQWATNGKLPDMYQFVAKTIREAADKLSPAVLGRLLNEKLDDLKALLEKIRWIVPSTIREHIEDLLKWIDTKGRAMVGAIQGFVQPVRTVLKVFAKRLDDHAWKVQTYRTNRGWIAPISESGSARLINAKPPKWAKKYLGAMKHPRTDMSTDEIKALMKLHPDHPPLQGWIIETFSKKAKIRADAIKGPAKLYRVIDPSNEGGGIFWMTEAEFKAIKNRDEWRSKFAVKPEWNQNGWVVEYEIKAGENLPVWRGPAASQKLKGTDHYLEGGGEQIVFFPGSRDEMVQAMPRIDPTTGNHILDHTGNVDRRVEYTDIAGEMVPTKLRAGITDPHIKGPIETGWGATDYTQEEAKRILLTVPGSP